MRAHAAGLCVAHPWQHCLLHLPVEIILLLVLLIVLLPLLVHDYGLCLSRERTKRVFAPASTLGVRTAVAAQLRLCC